MMATSARTKSNAHALMSGLGVTAEEIDITATARLMLENIGHAFADEARRSYMYGRAATIYGGSNEVQRGIIAKAVLGL